MSTQPFFIVGSGRSGTTLLRAMLNATGEVHVPPESDFLTRGFRFWGSRSDLGERDYPELVEFFRQTSEYEGWEMSPDTLHAALQGRQPRTFAEVADVFHRAYLENQGMGNLQWGIKRPVLIAGIDALLATYPNARIIHLLRDGRDVYLSYQRVHERSDVATFGPRSAAQVALYWVDGLRRVQEHIDDRFLEVRYEDLVADPATVGGRISSHLGTPFDADTWTAHHRTDRTQLRAGHEATLHAKVIRQVDSANVARWRTRMSRRKRLMFELFAGPYLNHSGYPREFEWLDVAPIDLLRTVAYVASRRFNDLRYKRRDMRFMNKVQERLAGRA